MRDFAKTGHWELGPDAKIIHPVRTIGLERINYDGDYFLQALGNFNIINVNI